LDIWHSCAEAQIKEIPFSFGVAGGGVGWRKGQRQSRKSNARQSWNDANSIDVRPQEKALFRVCRTESGNMPLRLKAMRALPYKHFFAGSWVFA
jgi:hypothetical protein